MTDGVSEPTVAGKDEHHGPHEHVRWLALALLLVVYSGLLATSIRLTGTALGTPVFYPSIGAAVGIAVVALRHSPAGWAALGLVIVAAEFLAWSVDGAGVADIALRAMIHAIEVVSSAAIAVWFRDRYQIRGTQIRTVLITVVAAVSGPTLVAPILGTASPWIAHTGPADEFTAAWWLADVLGIVVVVPFIMTLSKACRDAWQPSDDLFPGEVVVAALAMAGAIALLWSGPQNAYTFPGVFISVWIAIRLGVGATSLTVVLFASAMSFATGVNEGPFRGEFGGAWARVFIACYVIVLLVVSVIARERRRALDESISAQAEIQHAVSTDPLTGLFTRPYLEKQTAIAIRSRPVGVDWLALISIDLDDFASVNVRYGRDHADEAIRQIGNRLAGNLPEATCTARIGGDEYGLLLTGLTEERQAVQIAEQLRSLVSVPVICGDVQFSVTASVGVAVTNDGDVDQLLRDAEAALHDAKERGRNRLAVRTLRDREQARSEQKLLDRFPSALEEHEFGCVYQPIISLTGPAHGVEVLARWFHPEQGLLLPDQFLPLLQRSGVMRELSDYLFDIAIRQLHRWSAARPDLAPTWLSINISADELVDLRLPTRIRRVLNHSGVLAQHLMLEITEQTMVAFTADVRSQLMELRSMGVRIAVDDFGTGFSGLAYLTRLPIDVLKIDRQFLFANHDERAYTMLRGLCSLARDLGLVTIVEGVESAEELDLVRSLGADAVQGWYLGRPAAAEHLLATMPQTPAAPSPKSGEGGI